jgi:hypothetical protein
MVYCHLGICVSCGKEANLYNSSHICSDCENERLKRNKQNWLNNLRKGKTLLQRVEMLEQMLYEQLTHSHTEFIRY